MGGTLVARTAASHVVAPGDTTHREGSRGHRPERHSALHVDAVTVGVADDLDLQGVGVVAVGRSEHPVAVGVRGQGGGEGVGVAAVECVTDAVVVVVGVDTVRLCIGVEVGEAIDQRSIAVGVHRVAGLERVGVDGGVGVVAVGGIGVGVPVVVAVPGVASAVAVHVVAGGAVGHDVGADGPAGDAAVDPVGVALDRGIRLIVGDAAAPDERTFGREPGRRGGDIRRREDAGVRPGRVREPQPVKDVASRRLNLDLALDPRAAERRGADPFDGEGRGRSGPARGHDGERRSRIDGVRPHRDGGSCPVSRVAVVDRDVAGVRRGPPWGADDRVGESVPVEVSRARDGGAQPNIGLRPGDGPTRREIRPDRRSQEDRRDPGIDARRAVDSRGPGHEIAEAIGVDIAGRRDRVAQVGVRRTSGLEPQRRSPDAAEPARIHRGGPLPGEADAEVVGADREVVVGISVDVPGRGDDVPEMGARDVDLDGPLWRGPQPFSRSEEDVDDPFPGLPVALKGRPDGEVGKTVPARVAEARHRGPELRRGDVALPRPIGDGVRARGSTVVEKHPTFIGLTVVPAGLSDGDVGEAVEVHVPGTRDAVAQPTEVHGPLQRPDRRGRKSGGRSEVQRRVPPSLHGSQRRRARQQVVVAVAVDVPRPLQAVAQVLPGFETRDLPIERGRGAVRPTRERADGAVVGQGPALVRGPHGEVPVAVSVPVAHRQRAAEEHLVGPREGRARRRRGQTRRALVDADAADAATKGGAGVRRADHRVAEAVPVEVPGTDAVDAVTEVLVVGVAVDRRIGRVGEAGVPAEEDPESATSAVQRRVPDHRAHTDVGVAVPVDVPQRGQHAAEAGVGLVTPRSPGGRHRAAAAAAQVEPGAALGRLIAALPIRGDDDVGKAIPIDVADPSDAEPVFAVDLVPGPGPEGDGREATGAPRIEKRRAVDRRRRRVARRADDEVPVAVAVDVPGAGDARTVDLVDEVALPGPGRSRREAGRGTHVDKGPPLPTLSVVPMRRTHDHVGESIAVDIARRGDGLPKDPVVPVSFEGPGCGGTDAAGAAQVHPGGTLVGVAVVAVAAADHDVAVPVAVDVPGGSATLREGPAEDGIEDRPLCGGHQAGRRTEVDLEIPLGAGDVRDEGRGDQRVVVPVGVDVSGAGGRVPEIPVGGRAFEFEHGGGEQGVDGDRPHGVVVIHVEQDGVPVSRHR